MEHDLLVQIGPYMPLSRLGYLSVASNSQFGKMVDKEGK